MILALTVTLSLGWWLAPLIVTLIAWLKVARYCSRRKPGGDYDFGADILFGAALATIVTLFAWCLYFGAYFFLN